MKKFNIPLYAIAFVEGAAVMTTELGGAKLIAPFYGASLFVWSAVLAVTLGGLTLGYYLGGRATLRFNAVKLLMFELLGAAIWMLFMPLIALYFMPSTTGLGVKLGSLVSAAFILMPALVCMGMVSPTIIQLANESVKSTGNTAGTVYAVSTVGGILMTLFLGFYALPEIGIRLSLWISALPLLVFASILVFKTSINKNAYFISLAAGAVLLLITKRSFSPTSTDFTFLYKEEGVLGQLAVLENPINDSTTNRHLFINHIAQTWVDEKTPDVSKWKYPHRFATVASVKPAGSKALLIGLGGGSVASEFMRLGFELDAVELDTRVVDIAYDFFDLTMDRSRIHIDDGRHYIQETNQVYDIILVDVLNGETQPHHLFTTEAIKDFKRILDENGILMVNFQGYIEGKKGMAARSIFKTMYVNGFDVGIFASEGGGDIHFYATPGKVDLAQFVPERQNGCCKAEGIGLVSCITTIEIDTSYADVLVDDKPILEYYSMASNLEWREKALDAVIQRQIDHAYPFFN